MVLRSRLARPSCWDEHGEGGMKPEEDKGNHRTVAEMLGYGVDARLLVRDGHAARSAQTQARATAEGFVMRESVMRNL